jgi:hypothetical protein
VIFNHISIIFIGVIEEKRIIVWACEAPSNGRYLRFQRHPNKVKVEQFAPPILLVQSIFTHVNNGITVDMWGKTHCFDVQIKLSINSMHLSHSVNHMGSQLMCKYWLYEQNGRSKLFNLDFVWVTLEYGLFFLSCYEWCKFPFTQWSVDIILSKELVFNFFIHGASQTQTIIRTWKTTFFFYYTNENDWNMIKNHIYIS